MSRARATATIVGLALLATACGASDDGSGTATDSSPAVAADPVPATAPDAAPAPVADDDATTGAPVAVPAALQFSAPLVGGGDLDAASLAGRPTVFWFWAPT